MATCRAHRGLQQDRLADSALAAPRAGFGGVEAYPDFATKAAVLRWHLVKNHPLPDGNKRCAFLATVEFVERNGGTWVPAPGDPDETDRVIRGIASGAVSETEFRDLDRPALRVTPPGTRDGAAARRR